MSGDKLSTNPFKRPEILPAKLMTQEEFEAIHLAIEPNGIPPKVSQCFLGEGKDGKIALDDVYYDLLKVALAHRFKKYTPVESIDGHLEQVHYTVAFK